MSLSRAVFASRASVSVGNDHLITRIVSLENEVKQLADSVGDLAERLKQFTGRDGNRLDPTMANIKAVVCNAFNLTHEDLLGGRRTVRYAWPRQLAMYLGRRAKLTSTEIGLALGNRDHTTILHGARKTILRRERVRQFDIQAAEIEGRFRWTA